MLLYRQEMIEHNTLNPGKMPPENRERGKQPSMACELIGGDVLESLKKELDRTQRHAQGLRAAIAAYEAKIGPLLPPDGTPESRRWLRNNGKPVRPIEAIETLLQQHQGEMPTGKLFDLLASGGAFSRKRNPESAFKMSIHINVKLGKISQVDASGREMSWEEIMDLTLPSAILSGITRLKT
jgi:hypothetical protein